MFIYSEREKQLDLLELIDLFNYGTPSLNLLYNFLVAALASLNCLTFIVKFRISTFQEQLP